MVMNNKKKPTIIWVDGCFDMMHFGHANALRQAKELGDYLIVGVHSDKEIMRVKGPTVMNEEERYAAVEACKWVDQVVKDAPYTTELDMVKKYKVDWVVHGDDLAVDENGKDAYEAIKKAGLMKIVHRTKGVSTTDIVNRMLKLSKPELIIQSAVDYVKERQHLPTTVRVTQFASPIREPKQGDKIVYIDGGFDLFHVGHIEILKEAKKLGDYLIVGLHDDAVIEKHKGEGFPIMNLHERVLSVLSCKYVDDVVIGAPYVVTQELIDTLQVDIVVHGSVQDTFRKALKLDPYKIPKKLGIFKEITSPRAYLTTTAIVERILRNQQIFEERNAKKQKKEEQINPQKNTI